MTHDNDTIRRMVEETDRNMVQLQTLGKQSRAEQQDEYKAAYDAAKLFRFRLKDIGHGGRFDTPGGETP